MIDNEFLRQITDHFSQQEPTLLIIEIVAICFNVAYVILAAKENVWCWLFGFFGSFFSIFLWIAGQAPYQIVLFLFYALMSVFGWINWRPNEENPEENLKISHLDKGLAIKLILLGSVLVVFLGMAGKFIPYLPSQQPYLDAFVTVFSFIGTYLIAKKYLENWWCWIIVDLVAVFLYKSLGYELYALLSIFYLFMSAYGIWEWKKKIKLHNG